MIRELEALQWITLGSIGVLIVLCGLLLLVVWLAMNFLQITERLRATLLRLTLPTPHSPFHTAATPHALAIDDTVEYAALFRNELEPGQQAEVTEDLCWVMGSGFLLPAGSRVQLIRRYVTTTGGERWTAMHMGHFFSSIPAESLKPVATLPGGKCE